MSLISLTSRNARYLASEGFVVVAPNHFHHTPGEPDVVKRTKALRDVRLINDMPSTTDYLRSHPRVIPEVTAIMGHCMGGRATLSVRPSRAIKDYGGGVMRALGDP